MYRICYVYIYFYYSRPWHLIYTNCTYSETRSTEYLRLRREVAAKVCTRYKFPRRPRKGEGFCSSPNSATLIRPLFLTPIINPPQRLRANTLFLIVTDITQSPTSPQYPRTSRQHLPKPCWFGTSSVIFPLHNTTLRRTYIQCPYCLRDLFPAFYNWRFLPRWWREKKTKRHRKPQETTKDRNILQTSEYPATMDFIIWAVSSLFRWMRLKVYQYEVTFSLYMLTPIEKLIFSTFRLSVVQNTLSTPCWRLISYSDTLLLGLIAMIAMGTYIYLPDHLRAIHGRLYYYWAGERLFSSGRLSISSVFGENGVATQIGDMVYETAKNAAATSTERLGELWIKARHA